MMQGQVFISPLRRIAVQTRTQRGEMSDSSFILGQYPPLPLFEFAEVGGPSQYCLSTLRPTNPVGVLALGQCPASQRSDSTSEICRDAESHRRGADFPNSSTRLAGGTGILPVKIRGSDSWVVGGVMRQKNTPLTTFHPAQSARSPRRRQTQAEFAPVLLPDRNQESGGVRRCINRPGVRFRSVSSSH